METNSQIPIILAILQQTYPNATIALRYHNSWELLVAVILSAQCTDVRVNQITEKLFKKYPTLESYTKATLGVFENDIKSAGFFHHKATNILKSAKIIYEKYHGNIPDTMDQLLCLPGVARKTANVILGNAFQKVEGIAVDTHVHRISQRLRFVDLDYIGGKKYLYMTSTSYQLIDYKKDADPNKIEIELMKKIPKKHWFSLTYQIIDHGRNICKAQNPVCVSCPIREYCPVRRV